VREELTVADIIREGQSLHVRLTLAEKAASVHGDITIAVADVVAIESVQDISGQVHGMKLIGARLTGEFAIGTFVSKGSKVFAVVHHQHRDGIRIRLNATERFSEILLSCDDPASVIGRLSEHYA